MLRKQVPKCDFHNEDLCVKNLQIVSTYTYTMYTIHTTYSLVQLKCQLAKKFILNQTESSLAFGLSYGHEIPELSFDLAHKRFLDPHPP